jgi:hypothetical protein
MFVDTYTKVVLTVAAAADFPCTNRQLCGGPH